MAKEIERKFLVSNTAMLRDLKGDRIAQGYLNTNPERTVRVRIMNSEAWITIKSKTVGISRDEFEYPIPVADAEQLLMLCETTPINKKRYPLRDKNKDWVIDEFFDDNQGLVIAEIELTHEKEPIDKPDWLGEEVSDDQRYFNSALSKKPFKQWKEK